MEQVARLNTYVLYVTVDVSLRSKIKLIYCATNSYTHHDNNIISISVLNHLLNRL